MCLFSLTFKESKQMKNVEKFNSPLFGELRCIQNEEGAPLFCLADVCASLELRVNDVIKRTGCAPEIIGVSKEVVSHGKGTGKFKEEGMYFVTEPDLYRCIFQSRKSSARSFQDWVFAEVIPALRKDGAYVVANQQDDDETLMAKALIAANRAIKRNEERVRQLEAQTKEQAVMIEQKDATIGLQQKELTVAAPKVKYYDDTLASTDCITTTQVADDLGISAKALNQKLAQLGIQYYQSQSWHLKGKYREWKLASTRTYNFVRSDGSTGTNVRLVWNQRGKRFIVALYNNDFNEKAAIAEIVGEQKQQAATLPANA